MIVLELVFESSGKVGSLTGLGSPTVNILSALCRQRDHVFSTIWNVSSMESCGLHMVSRAAWYGTLLRGYLHIRAVILKETDPDPVNTKHLYTIWTMLDQRRRRWANVVQMLCKCFVFAGDLRHLIGSDGGFLGQSQDWHIMHTQVGLYGWKITHFGVNMVIAFYYDFDINFCQCIKINVLFDRIAKVTSRKWNGKPTSQCTCK